MDDSRRVPELDILRAAIVAGVLVFHAVHVFDPLDFYVKSGAEWQPLVPLILFCALWGMPLLFLLAGVGIRHSLRSRTPRAFARERAARLLVPFVAGTVLLVPPQLHVQRAVAGVNGSYGDTLREFFHVRPDLSFPIPLEGSGTVGEFEPAVLEAALGSEDTGGWHRTVYMVLLVYGFVFAGEPALRAAAARAARPAAWAGLLGFALLAATGLALDTDELLGGRGAGAIAWRAGKGVVGWLLLITVVVLVGRLRPRAPAAVLRYCREAVLPVYMLHQTVVVLLAWWIVGWDVPPALQLPALIVLTVVATLALYELLRRVPGVPVLLGQRKRSSSRARISAAAPAPASTVT